MHTFGPWKLDLDDRLHPKVRGADGSPVCSFGNQARHQGLARAVANAALIADAPDLLAACEAFVSLIDNRYRIQYCYHGLQDAYYKAVAAIAAARPGEESGE